MTEGLQTTASAWGYDHLASQQQALGIHQNVAAVSALDAFLARGLPTRRTPTWQQTPLARLLQQQAYWTPSAHPAKVKLSGDRLGEHLPSLRSQVDRLVVIDGQVCLEQSTLDTAAAGLTIEWIEVASAGMPSPTDFAHLTEEIPLFNLLNQALTTLVCKIHLAPQQRYPRPLQLLWINTGEQPALMQHPRYHWSLGAHSELVILEDYVFIGKATADSVHYLNNIVTTIDLGPGAQLQHYKLQQEAKTALQVAHTQATLQEASRYHFQSLHLGGRLSRDSLTVNLVEPSAECQIAGLYLPQGEQHHDLQVQVSHQASHTTSQQLVKGVLADRGRAVFNGSIAVQPQVSDVRATQSNHHLLLSDRAQVSTQPTLTVDAEDVQCSHGATIGQLDPDALFYCQSRGLSLLQAQSLLLHAFVNEVLDQIAIPALRADWGDWVATQFNQLSIAERV